MKIFSILLIASISLTGCNTVPKIIQGDFAEISPNQSKTNHVLDKNIRWSGYIVQTINQKDKTCFELVETDTYKDLSPKRIIPKNGSRFLACKDGFLEPTAFDKRLVTITGNIVAYTEKQIGEYNYEYPVVKTDKIYIWRNSPRNNNFFINHHFVFHRFTNFSCRYSSMRGYCFP